jgi:hypothetical protein
MSAAFAMSESHAPIYTMTGKRKEARNDRGRRQPCVRVRHARMGVGARLEGRGMTTQTYLFKEV